MLSGKVGLFYEINSVASPSIMWFCDMMKSSIDSSRRYFTPEKPLISNNVVKKISFSSEQQWISKFKPFGEYFQ